MINNMLKNNKKSNKGITLISLIITIILLLILAGVTINFAIGENGIFKLAEDATKKYENSAINEKNAIAQAEYYLTNNREDRRTHTNNIFNK